MFRLGSPPASWLYLRNPLLQVWRWGYLRSRSQDSCSLRTVMIVGAPECILWSLPPQLDWVYQEGQDPISTGAEGTAASPFPMLGNVSHPFHPTPGQLPSFRLGVEGGWVNPGWEMAMLLIILQDPDSAPCGEDSAPSPQKFLIVPLHKIPFLRKVPKETLEPGKGRREAAGSEC